MPKATKPSISDSNSGPVDQNSPPAMKTKELSNDKQNSKGSGDNENHWVLEKQRQVHINEFKGHTYIDIRQYYERNGETFPGKKGISLTVDQWEQLLGIADEINQALLLMRRNT